MLVLSSSSEVMRGSEVTRGSDVTRGSEGEAGTLMVEVRESLESPASEMVTSSQAGRAWRQQLGLLYEPSALAGGI